MKNKLSSTKECIHDWEYRPPAIGDYGRLCRKCGTFYPMTVKTPPSSPPERSSGWEKEFDEKFTEEDTGFIADYINGKMLMAKQIKDFIKQELQKQKREIVEEIKRFIVDRSSFYTKETYEKSLSNSTQELLKFLENKLKK